MHRKTVWILRGVLLVGFGLAVFFTCKLFSTAPGAGNGEVAPPLLSTSTPEQKGEEGSEDTYMTQVREILSGMTLSEKIGQMFFVRCPESGGVESVSEYALGGYLLFARDFEPHTADTMQTVIQSYQDAAKIPLFIPSATVSKRRLGRNCFGHYRKGGTAETFGDQCNFCAGL